MGGIQCSICLELVNGEAYLDQCFHRFCYHCILQWAEMLFNKQSDSLPCLLCPLCKVKNSSIIHNFVGSTFQRHYISKLPEKSFVMSEAHYRRLQIYSEPPDAACSNVQALKHWDRYGNLQSSCWLQCWIRRELQSLMQEEDVDIVMHHTLGILESFHKRTNTANKYSTRELKSRPVQWKSLISNALSPFIFENSVRFADELEAFLVSGLDIATYDEQVLRRSATGDTSSCSSGKELSSKDASGSYVSSQYAFNARGGKSKEGTRVNLFDLLDEDVDLIAEKNTGA
ncbi:hypothetical protein SUGI_0790290 [Cryptomeria japonica]|uniref:uncharacterized protein LOC131028878 isoform X1 n=1 Tax=Cryptomeria japonica TaxID=3369 RepID=UPI002414B6A2|nr:uncharacterized protein LOC131028878 isoform X1 [Cryptomeria japonica]GLJ38763.1 hypothetical protein SUGI_0790290 [Cryptomeria japonica]